MRGIGALWRDVQLPQPFKYTFPGYALLHSVYGIALKSSRSQDEQVRRPLHQFGLLFHSLTVQENVKRSLLERRGELPARSGMVSCPWRFRAPLCPREGLRPPERAISLDLVFDELFSARASGHRARRLTRHTGSQERSSL